MIRPLSNQIFLKMREDLEDNWGQVIRVNKMTGAIEPRPVYGEVIAVGPGDPIQPDIPELVRGDIVVWDLSKVGPPLMNEGKSYSIISFNAVLGRLENPKTDGERCYAMLDYVLTRRAPLAMAQAVSPLLVAPDTVLSDGIQEDADSPIKTVYERVVSVGSGIVYAGRKYCARCKEELRNRHVPEIRGEATPLLGDSAGVLRGDLVAFNPMHSVEWRRRGEWLRFTPYSEIRGAVE